MRVGCNLLVAGDSQAGQASIHNQVAEAVDRILAVVFVRSLVGGDNQAVRVLLRSPAGQAGQAVRIHMVAAEVVDRNLVVVDSRVGHHIDQTGEPHTDQGEGHHIDQEEGHHIARVEERRTGPLGVAVHQIHPWCQKTSQWHPKAF